MDRQLGKKNILLIQEHEPDQKVSDFRSAAPQSIWRYYSCRSVFIILGGGG